MIARYALEGAEVMLADPDVQKLVRQYRERVASTLDKTDAEVLGVYVRYLADCRGITA